MDRTQCEDNTLLTCSMCFFCCDSNEPLINHAIRSHRHDPRFRVTCTHSGCGASFQKWASYQQHLFRKHQGGPVNLDKQLNLLEDIDNVQQDEIEEDNPDHNNEGNVQHLN